MVDATTKLKLSKVVGFEMQNVCKEVYIIISRSQYWKHNLTTSPNVVVVIVISWIKAYCDTERKNKLSYLIFSYIIALLITFPRQNEGAKRKTKSRKGTSILNILYTADGLSDRRWVE
jgi:hypothetical protein